MHRWKKNPWVVIPLSALGWVSLCYFWYDLLGWNGWALTGIIALTVLTYFIVSDCEHRKYNELAEKYNRLVDEYNRLDEEKAA